MISPILKLVMLPEVVGVFVEMSLVASGGIGVYDGFTHVDVREVMSRWVGCREDINKSLD